MHCLHHARRERARSIVSVPLMLLVLLSLSCSEEKTPVAATPPDPDLTWTYIVYDAADGSASDIYDNYLMGTSMHSSERVDLIGMHDSEDTEGKYWRIDEQNNLVTLEELGEINTGSEETVYDLVMYAKNHYPADCYIIAFYGHGGAWLGCCGDATSQDGLRLHEIRGALDRAGGVDMVLFTAPCLMGCVETAYELRDCTDIVLASEDFSCFFFWQYTLDDAFSAMHLTPKITPVGLSNLIIEQMPKYMDLYTTWDLDSFMTMSALRTDKIEPLRGAIDDLAAAYLENPGAFEAIVDLHCEDMTVFGDDGINDAFLVDINSLVQHLLLTETDETIRMLLERIPNCIEEAVFAECHAENYTDVMGLSIFLPMSDYQWLSYYMGEEDISLEFAEDTKWDELISVLVESPPASPPTLKAQGLFECPVPLLR